MHARAHAHTHTRTGGASAPNLRPGDIGRAHGEGHSRSAIGDAFSPWSVRAFAHKVRKAHRMHRTHRADRLQRRAGEGPSGPQSGNRSRVNETPPPGDRPADASTQGPSRQQAPAARSERLALNTTPSAGPASRGLALCASGHPQPRTQGSPRPAYCSAGMVFNCWSLLKRGSAFVFCTGPCK